MRIDVERAVRAAAARRPPRRARRRAPSTRRPGRSRPPRRRRRLTAREVDRHQAAHARAAHRDASRVDLRALGEQARQRSRSSITRVPRSPSRLAVAAVVEGQRGEALADGGTREVGVVLLARARAVQDHARPGPGRRRPAARGRTRCRRRGLTRRVVRRVLHNGGDYGRHRPRPRLSPRHARQRARPSRGRRLRRRRARPSDSARPPTSTPRTTCAPARAPTWRRSRRAPTTSR